MVARLASNDSNSDLSPVLRPVLSSLNVSLESELNRYRRNRLTKDASSDSVFADLDDSAFDINVADIEVAAAAVTTPPPVPPNRRINGQTSSISVSPVPPANALERSPSQSNQTASSPTSSNPSDTVLPGSIVNVTAIPSDSPSEPQAPNGYLASSEKLIESLDDLPPMPEPVDIAPPKSRRKTVSLLAGAVLGLLGLIAGLGVSYIVSSPAMMQRIANLFNREPEEATIADAEDTFSPPGPDLSEREFVDLDLDNLSSLEMSPDPLNPANNPNAQALPGLPPTAAQLPPIEQPTSPDNIQAAVIPAGVTYYVTVPFATEQDLTNVRQAVDEAFVRAFSDGDRIQIAAFDNPTDAQAFVADIRAQGITAFVYGPTTE